VLLRSERSGPQKYPRREDRQDADPDLAKHGPSVVHLVHRSDGNTANVAL
jgi:hypothetical protein